MKKTLAILTATTLLSSSAAFAAPSTNLDPADQAVTPASTLLAQTTEDNDGDPTDEDDSPEPQVLEEDMNGAMDGDDGDMAAEDDGDPTDEDHSPEPQVLEEGMDAEGAMDTDGGMAAEDDGDPTDIDDSPDPQVLDEDMDADGGMDADTMGADDGDTAAEDDGDPTDIDDSPDPQVLDEDMDADTSTPDVTTEGEEEIIEENAAEERFGDEAPEN